MSFTHLSTLRQSHHTYIPFSWTTECKYFVDKVQVFDWNLAFDLIKGGQKCISSFIYQLLTDLHWFDWNCICDSNVPVHFEWVWLYIHNSSTVIVYKLIWYTLHSETVFKLICLAISIHAHCTYQLLWEFKNVLHKICLCITRLNSLFCLFIKVLF